jgi:transcriptional regulator with XRE-family HTH domain
MLRIKAERQKRKWSQTTLAARAGSMSAADISRIENGLLKPYPQQLARLARALKVPPDQLLEPNDESAEDVREA